MEEIKLHARPSEGFREINWGTRQKDIPWQWSSDGFPAPCFIRADEDLHLYGIEVDAITYTFRNSVFYGVRIDYTGCIHNATVLRHLMRSYRPLDGVTHRSELERCWRTEDTSAFVHMAADGVGRGTVYLWGRNRMFADDIAYPAYLAKPPQINSVPGPLEPRSYVCYRTSGPIVIDGRLDEKAWRDAPWSQWFEDHQAPYAPPPWKTTRFKMLHDDENLYFGAELQEENVYGTLTERDCVIYYDNDFEIFLDPTSDGVGYYEFEINPLNTVWDMFHETDYHRASALHTDYDIAGLEHAISVQGTLNSHHDEDVGWTVEVAWPIRALLDRNPRVSVPIKRGDTWRANFSRVQYMHTYDHLSPSKLPESPCEDWVWQSTNTGDLHNPEMWGRIVFSDMTTGSDTDTDLERGVDLRSKPDPICDREASMVAFPASEFRMGPDPTDPLRSPAHVVQLDGFEMDRYPVTVGEFASFLNASRKDIYYDSRMRIPELCGITPLEDGAYEVVPGREDYPVVFVSLEGAVAYAASVKRSLPTESQWERAARGLEGRTYAWGDRVIAPELANYDFHYGGTTPVGSLPDGATPDGLFDMTGNVKEYTTSMFASYPGGEEMIYLGMREPFIHEHRLFNVVRGGAWTKQEACMSAAYRDSHGSLNLGFRCVRN